MRAGRLAVELRAGSYPGMPATEFRVVVARVGRVVGGGVGAAVERVIP